MAKYECRVQNSQVHASRKLSELRIYPTMYSNDHTDSVLLRLT